MKIFSGSSNLALAQGIGDYLHIPLGAIELGEFPGGETFVQINEEVRNEDTFIIQSTHHPANQHIMEMLMIIDALRRASAYRVTAVLPYFGYARQDRPDKSHVPITAKLIANLLVTAGVDRILTMDLHSPQMLGFFDIPVDHLSAIPIMINHIRTWDWDYENTVICSPDIGGIKMAIAYADALNCPLVVMRKQRLDRTRVAITHIIGEVRNKHILLVDDIVETAGTLSAAAQWLKENGALSIKAAVVHHILTPAGQERLKNSAIELLITTNTTAVHRNEVIPAVKLDLCPFFGEAIRQIHNHRSPK
ncbi:MAG: ribose-phosphate pyrophosphokinase [Puniceicoccales bacterium]|jgi:ribose-phosphate pyrophosphokinase|nr:ribose-phosphate pyrophosphokinase [Puniceicoccales bacterium]